LQTPGRRRAITVAAAFRPYLRLGCGNEGHEEPVDDVAGNKKLTMFLERWLTETWLLNVERFHSNTKERRDASHR